MTLFGFLIYSIFLWEWKIFLSEIIYSLLFFLKANFIYQALKWLSDPIDDNSIQILSITFLKKCFRNKLIIVEAYFNLLVVSLS